jgi:hypothetical protein
MLTNAPITAAKTLAGPPVPAHFVAFFGMHGIPPPGTHMLAIVGRQKDGQWRTLWSDFTQTGEEACVDLESIAETKLVMPPESRREDDEMCFRPGS